MLVAMLLARVTLEYGGRAGRFLSRAFAGGFHPAVRNPVGEWRRSSGRCSSTRRSDRVDALIGSPIALARALSAAGHHRHRRVENDAVRDVPALRRDHVDRAARSSKRQDSMGQTRWQEFRHLTLPAILPVVAVTAAFRAVDAFTKAFDIILATTAGGPGQATMVFPLYIWRTAFISLHFGEASALAVIAIVISGSIGASLLAMNRRAKADGRRARFAAIPTAPSSCWRHHADHASADRLDGAQRLQAGRARSTRSRRRSCRAHSRWTISCSSSRSSISGC